MANHPPPSFYIILMDHAAPHVKLPLDFMTKHLKNKIPNDPIIRSANGGYFWKLKIKKVGENYCFAHGWNNVVKDINLGFGDFLFFLLVDQSTFKMFVYGLNGCEKSLLPKINIDDDDVVVSEDVVDDDDVDDEDDAVDDDEDEDDGDDDEDDDDVDVDVDIDDDDDNDVDDYEEDGEDNEGDIDGDDGDPFFTPIITKTHKSIMRLPPWFVELVGIDDVRPITMKDRDGEDWPMEIRLDKLYKRYYLSSGWPKFMRSNNLLEGDACVIKYITSEDKLCLAKVTEKRRVAKLRRRKLGKG